MKKTTLLLIILILGLQFSCITDKNKYKETDIFEEYEAENGFAILHIPPVLFKIVLSLSDDEEYNSKELLDKVEVIKFMMFEEKENTLTLDDLKHSLNAKIKDFNYNLLTRIAQEDNDISIYIIESENSIREVLVTIISENEYMGINILGELTKEEVMKVYKSINMDKVKLSGN
ncbi:MAG: DUF4252 domain-containing protein [Bacteroidales bacterium]|nr:DUF4252 domain-containing protein [Bacteroidales bacterium]